MADMSEGAGAQPAYAAFYPRPLKNRIFRSFFFDIIITQNDHPRYVKHVLRRIYVFFTSFGYWARRGVGVPNGLVHNLLMQFSTVGSSTVKVFKLILLMFGSPKITIQDM